MTSTEEQQLWVQFKEHGSEAAREALIVDYMRVVKFVAGRMAIHVPASIDMDDLVGWGVLGLMDAVEKFDTSQNVKFSTYCTIRVRGAIIDQIRSLDWAPRSLRSMARKIGAARDKLRNEIGHDPAPQDIADELNTSAEEVEDTIAKVQTAHVLSLDDYLTGEDGEEARRLDLAVDVTVKSPLSEAEVQERQERLAEAILALSDQQQKVLNLYYFEELTLKEIGLVLEVSESRICQIHGAALKKLRQVVREHVS